MFLTLNNIVTPKSRQILAGISIGLVMSGLMSSLGYASVALPQMERENSTIQFTPSQSSWFATLPLFMCIPGSLVGASICEWTGPRKLYLLLTPVLCISTMAMAIASWEVITDVGMEENFLLTLRFIQGTLVSVLQPCAYVYTFEICDQHIRGTMTSLLDVWYSVGFLLCYVAGCFLPWTTIAWMLPLITYVPGLFGVLLSSEAPLWLCRKGKEETSREVLNKYRCSSQEVEENLKVAMGNSKGNMSYTENLRLLIEKPNALAILTSNVITITKELTGSMVIVIYLVHIFDATGVGLEPKYSSVIVGTLRLICNVTAWPLVHNFRRKVLLISGNALAGVVAFALGLFFYLQNSGYDVSYLTWLPLAGLALHTFACSAVIGPTAWTMSVEVLPGSVRSVGFGIALTSFSIVTFIISKLFKSFQSLIGMYGIFWIFASGALVCIVTVVFFIPETYGLSLQDIEAYWKGSKDEKATKDKESKV